MEHNIMSGGGSYFQSIPSMVDDNSMHKAITLARKHRHEISKNGM
jgi:hypothetical protein